MRQIFIIFAILALVFLSSCSTQEKTFHEKIDEQYITVTIDQASKYDADLFIAEDDILTEEEIQANWDKYMQDRQDQDHYLTMVKIQEREENPFHLEEEDRIEKYCDDAGFAACRTITSTCNDDGCYKVEVKCRDYDWYEGDDYDDCNIFEVDVEPEIDDELTQAEKLKTCEENNDDFYISLSCDEM